MLQAKSNTGILTTLATLTRLEIESLKKKDQFICPTCNGRVIIKAGSKVIPHFAHYSNVKCPSNIGGEGPYHEKGKLILYQWLKKQSIEVELEKYIQTIHQQPDLLFTINNKTVAIEFQCSRVGIDQIHKRNNGYKKIGITPIWILGANRFKRQDTNRLKVDEFTLQFIHQFSPTYPLNLFYFCPNTNQIISFQHIYITKPGQAIGKFRFLKLSDLLFKGLFIQHLFPKERLYELWKLEKKRFRLKNRKHLSRKEYKWHQWLYLKRSHIEQLPSIVHLPVSTQYKMRKPLWEWQSRLCLEILHPLPVGAHFTIETCIQKLRNYFHHPDYYPLIKSADNPINEYLQLLTQLNILQQISPQKFKKIQSIRNHKLIEPALKADDFVMNQLLESATNKKQA